MNARMPLVCIAAIVTAGLSTAARAESPKSPDPVALTNYRSGISLVIRGTSGRDYAVERFYHDAKVDDRSVIYIKSTTPLGFEHNERNTMHSGTTAPWKEIGVNGADGKPASGDEGIIRYKVDRDQQVKLAWSAKTGKTHKPKAVCPEYTAPLTFATLEYEPGVAVLGALGKKPGVEPGSEVYYRGTADAYNDQWHTITVADDDGAMQGDYYSHKWASDGKVFLFVVDPKTPCVSLKVRTPGSQYYTTPPKTYFLPKIHEQTSYVTGGIDILLTNVTNDQPLQWRLDGGAFRPYAGPISTDPLADGRHVLEYKFTGGTTKTRVIVKNPPSPSADERHGYLMWADEVAFAALKARLQREPYKGAWKSLRTRWNGQQAAEKRLGRGARDWVGAALTNALVARILGPEAKASDKSPRSYAAYAKWMLLENKLTIDPVGFEMSHNFAPMPTAEWNTFGYYAVNTVYDAAFAYDLLISFYRADQAPGGVTPIEDLKIRDALARWTAVQVQGLRGYEGEMIRRNQFQGQQASAKPQTGMWDMARLSGAAICAMAMPSYDTPYYGTSGFDGRKARYTDLPFAGQAFTWKELFIDADQPVAPTPKLRRRFNHLDGGLITEDGHFRDRPGYYSYALMGHCFMILANAAKISCDKEWPYLEKSFGRAIDGTLEGKKINSPGDKGPRRYLQILLVNSRFPNVANKIRDFVAKQTPKRENGRRNDNDIGFQMYLTRPYGLIWYQDDWDKPQK